MGRFSLLIIKYRGKVIDIISVFQDFVLDDNLIHQWGKDVPNTQILVGVTEIVKSVL